MVGHRGYPVKAPENTIASLDLAIEKGMEVVKLKTKGLSYTQISEKIDISRMAAWRICKNKVSITNEVKEKLIQRITRILSKG